MKIQYISCHAILEYDEVKLLSELGYDMHSNGAYRDPRGAYTLPRPGIDTIPLDEEFLRLTAEHPKTNLPPQLIEPYDTFIFMSGEHEAALINNWSKIKHKRVILRMIGQSTPGNEMALQHLVSERLQIVRYSPKERGLTNFAGEDAMIRFTKDPAEFQGWTGTDNRPVNFTQSLRGRGANCHYDEIMGAMVGYNGAMVYGSGNADLGAFNGGEMPYEKLKAIMRDSRCFVYGGTWPASYTLSFIEAWMTGIPIVAISKSLAHMSGFEQIDFYEVDELITNGVDGFVCDSVQDMRACISKLLADHELAKTISANAQKKAREVFGIDIIKQQWKAFLG